MCCQDQDVFCVTFQEENSHTETVNLAALTITVRRNDSGVEPSDLHMQMELEVISTYVLTLCPGAPGSPAHPGSPGAPCHE